MADKLVASQDDTGAIRRFRDMGDTTYAEVVSLAAGAAGAASYPAGATPVANFATGANAITTATLPGAVGKTTYLTGIDITGGGATSATVISATLSNALGGSHSFVVLVPAGPTTANIPPLSIRFNPPLPATGLNTAIAVALGAAGAGNIVQNVSAYGFQL